MGKNLPTEYFQIKTGKSICFLFEIGGTGEI